MTSPPSARPLVSFITAPTIAPIAFPLPARTCSAAVGVGRDRRLDDRPPARRVARSGPGPRARRSPPGRRPRRRARQHLLPPPWEICFAPTSADQLGQRLGGHFDSAGPPSSPASRSAAASSPVTQLATARGSASARAERPLEVGGRLRVGGEQRRRRRRPAPALLVAGDPRRRQLGQRLAGLAQHLLGRRQRHQVGLGEVAVVVRLLLGAQRRQRCRSRVEVERLLVDRPPRRRAGRAGARARPRPRARGSGSCSCSSARSSCPAPRCPPGRTETLASHPQAALLHVHVGDAELADRRRAAAAPTRAPGRRCAGRAR